jgi:hypothetical protein
MNVDYLTHIGRHVVPVRNAKFVSIVSFAGGAHGKKERGHYLFWTAVLKGRAKRRFITGRARVFLQAGDRFDRMKREMKNMKFSKETRDAYRGIWHSMNGGARVKYIRPASASAIAKWFASHGSDARHVNGMYLH